MRRGRRSVLAAVVVALTFGAGSAVAASPPKLVLLKILFPEGYTVRQMSDQAAAVRKIAIRKRHVTPLLSGKTYSAAAASAKPPASFRRFMTRSSIEGFLFPSTYVFGPRDPAARVVALQQREFAREWAKLDLTAAAGKGVNPYQVLTIASMVEREAAVASERPLVAAVIYNRLAAGMPLGIDATLRYGLGIPGTSSLTQAELQNPTPYNTRLHTGLPPTPIANPGLPSLRAAASPAAVDYLYYVRIPGTQTHFFTSDFTEFCAKKAEYGYGSC